MDPKYCKISHRNLALRAYKNPTKCSWIIDLRNYEKKFYHHRKGFLILDRDLNIIYDSRCFGKPEISLLHWGEPTSASSGYPTSKICNFTQTSSLLINKSISFGRKSIILSKNKPKPFSECITLAARTDCDLNTNLKEDVDLLFGSDNFHPNFLIPFKYTDRLSDWFEVIKNELKKIKCNVHVKVFYLYSPFNDLRELVLEYCNGNPKCSCITDSQFIQLVMASNNVGDMGFYPYKKIYPRSKKTRTREKKKICGNENFELIK